jgi:hypothetical protein
MYEPELSITKKSQLDEENGIIVFLGNMKKRCDKISLFQSGILLIFIVTFNYHENFNFGATVQRCRMG